MLKTRDSLICRLACIRGRRLSLHITAGKDVKVFHPDYINNPIIFPTGVLTEAAGLNTIIPYQNILDGNAVLK